MSYLFDKRYFGEAEDEFENQVSQEQDRYSSLRDRMLSGQTLGYDELEELFAAAKARNDAHVVDALKNVVGNPPADENEELYEDMMEDALRKDEDEIRRPENRPHNLHRADEAELSQGEMDDIADMFAGYSGRSAGDESAERRRRTALDFMRRHADELRQMLDQPSQSGSLGDFSHAYDFEANESGDTDGGKLGEEEFAEKEELLPDSLVNEALETLRRMY